MGPEPIGIGAVGVAMIGVKRPEAAASTARAGFRSAATGTVMRRAQSSTPQARAALQLESPKPRMSIAATSRPPDASSVATGIQS